MNETSKSRQIWGELERAVLTGSGIDIGCGPDPVMPEARRFDLEHGDANAITRHVHEQFDYVYSSHCLEHMRDPRAAVLEWWRLVRPGGHLFFAVPDEDLYEQGVFPSRFNAGHTATFTIEKERSWSPVSINVRALAATLPGGRIVRLALQDHGYDRTLQRMGPETRAPLPLRPLVRLYHALECRGWLRVRPLDRLKIRYRAIDQTKRPGVLAQIQCIVRKER
jgi:SAM-dependent methyltransferase